MHEMNDVNGLQFFQSSQSWFRSRKLDRRAFRFHIPANPVIEAYRRKIQRVLDSVHTSMYGVSSILMTRHVNVSAGVCEVRCV